MNATVRRALLVGAGVRWPKLIHTEPPTNIAVRISTLLLSNTTTWDTLTASCPSATAIDAAAVDHVLLNLREPSHARKALLFFHWSSHCRRSPHPLKSYCLAAHILARAALVADASALLNSAIAKHSNSAIVDALIDTYEMSSSTPKVFDLLLQTFCRLRMLESGFDCCKRITGLGLTPSLHSCNTLLLAAQKSNNGADLAWKVYEYMLHKRIYPNQETVKIMIDLLCKQGVLNKTVTALDRICGKRCAPIIIVNTFLGMKIIEENRIEDATILLQRMLMKNSVTDSVVYSLIIFGYCKMDRLELAKSVYTDMVNRGCSLNSFTYTSFIGAHCRRGRVEEACDLLQEMLAKGLKPYDETYNSLIESCSRMGLIQESLNLFKRLIAEKFIPDCSTLTEMIGMLCNAGEADKANSIVTFMLDRGFSPNDKIYLKLIHGYGEIGKDQEIVKLYYEMEHRCLVAGHDVYTASIQNLCKCGKLMEAEKFLDIMKGKLMFPNESIYDALVMGYLKKGDRKRALSLYDEMINKGLVPNAHTFEILIKAISEDNGLHFEVLRTFENAIDSI